MPIDAAAYRKVIGAFATGVTVITTEVEGRLHGFTANAVASLSLDPILILVCVDKRAHAHHELARAKSFAVNILAEHQQDVSNLFARSSQPLVGSLRGVPFHRRTTGAPLLDESLASLECETYRALDGGDHTIHLGRVVDATLRTDVRPLLYYLGAYRTLG